MKSLWIQPKCCSMNTNHFNQSHSGSVVALSSWSSCLRPLSFCSVGLSISTPVTLLLPSFPLRIRPCSAQHRWRESVLHALRTPRYPSHLGHVPECGRTDQHFCQIPAPPFKETPWYETHRGLHGQHGDHRLHILHEHSGSGSHGVLSLWRMELLPCFLLLFYHTHHYWLWGLCGTTEGRSAAETARLRGLQLHLHPNRPRCDRSLPQPGCAEVHDHELWGWEKRCRAEGSSRS